MKFLSLFLTLMLCISAHANIIKISTGEQYEKEMSVDGPRVILFSAKWCGFCTEFHPLYEKLSNQVSIRFYEIDVDEIGIKTPYLPFMLEVNHRGQKPCLVNLDDRTERGVTLEILRCIKAGL